MYFFGTENLVCLEKAMFYTLWGFFVSFFKRIHFGSVSKFKIPHSSVHLSFHYFQKLIVQPDLPIPIPGVSNAAEYCFIKAGGVPQLRERVLPSKVHDAPY